MCIYASMFIRQQGIHWSWWKPLSVTTKLRHWMTKGKPAISIPRAATSVQIRKRTSWTGSYEHIHGKLRFEYYDLNTQLGSALNKWRETWEIHAVVWEIEWTARRNTSFGRWWAVDLQRRRWHRFRHPLRWQPIPHGARLAAENAVEKAMGGGKATLCGDAKICKDLCRILLFRSLQVCKLKEYEGIMCDSQKSALAANPWTFILDWKMPRKKPCKSVEWGPCPPNHASTSEAYLLPEATEAWRSWRSWRSGRFLKSTVLAPLLHDCFEELLVVLHFTHELFQIARVDLMRKAVGLKALRCFFGICPGAERPSDGFHLIQIHLGHLGVCTKPIIFCWWITRFIYGHIQRHISLKILKIRDWGGFLWQAQAAHTRTQKTWRGVSCPSLPLTLRGVPSCQIFVSMAG